jgi:hypothetical protein
MFPATRQRKIVGKKSLIALPRSDEGLPDGLFSNQNSNLGKFLRA